MKIKVCKTYEIDQIIYEFDSRRSWYNDDFTSNSDYSSTFIEEDVTEEQLKDYIKKGYAIKINY